MLWDIKRIPQPCGFAFPSLKNTIDVTLHRQNKTTVLTIKKQKKYGNNKQHPQFCNIKC